MNNSCWTARRTGLTTASIVQPTRSAAVRRGGYMDWGEQLYLRGNSCSRCRRWSRQRCGGFLSVSSDNALDECRVVVITISVTVGACVCVVCLFRIVGRLAFASVRVCTRHSLLHSSVVLRVWDDDCVRFISFLRTFFSRIRRVRHSFLSCTN